MPEIPDESADPTTAGELTPSPQCPPASHDATGLDVARTAATALRGVARLRSRTNVRSAKRTGQPELSGAHPDGRDPMLLGNAVDRLVADSGWTTDVAVHAVFARWPAIVGNELAAHCTPQSYADGMLTIRTDSTAWATQLRLLAPTVVRRLNDELGNGTVLRIEVRGPDAPSWRRGPRSVRNGRGPRDTYG
ncbi:MAG: DciA family protein [Nocardioidaceae bacterium]